MSPARFRWFLLTITLAGLAWRVVYALVWRRRLLPLYGDSYYYTGGANLLADGRGFIEPYWVFRLQIRPSASHPPLYEVYLAVLSWFQNGNTAQIQHMLWSSVLGAASIVVIGYVGRIIGGARCGLIAAAIAAFYPNIWVHDGQLLSETMAIFVTALIALLSYRFLARGRVLDSVLLGGACGLAALTRSELVLLVVLLLVPIALRGPTPWRDRLVRAAAGFVAAAVVMSPWIIYNQGRFAKPVLLSTQFGGTIAAANCDETYYGPNLGSKSYDCTRYFDVMVKEQSTVDETEFDASLRPKVYEYIKRHKRRVPAVVAVRVLRTFELWRPHDDVEDDQLYLERERWVAEASLWTWYLVAGFAVYGFVVARRRRVPVLPLVMIGVATMFGIAITFAQTRYRAPLEVVVVLLAALAVDDLVARRARRRDGDSGGARAH